MSLSMIEIEAGRALVFHRLALAVVPIDAATGRPIGPGLRVGRETVWSVDRAFRTPRFPGRTGRPAPYPAIRIRGGYGPGYLLRHRRTDSADAVVRIEDPTGNWLPRRLSIPLWTLPDAEACDRVIDPDTGMTVEPTGPFVPPAARSVEPWLLPGPGYRAPSTTTGIRTCVTRGGKPVAWPRVVAFNAAGQLLGWAHGDEHGDLLLLASEQAAFPPPGTASLTIALRASGRPATEPTEEIAQRLRAGDRLAALRVEPFPRAPIVPPGGPPSSLATGLSVPSGYVTAADVVETIGVGRISRIDDLVLPPNPLSPMQEVCPCPST